MLTKIEDQRVIDELNRWLECQDTLEYDDIGYNNMRGNIHGEREDGTEYEYTFYERQSHEIKWKGFTYICREMLIEIDEFNPTELRPDTTQWYLVEENADG